MTDLTEILQALHDSEINGGLSWLYDGVWQVWLGIDVGNPDAGALTGSPLQAAEWLRAKAVELYPDSEFAKKYRRGFE